jgi:hypothetical protein
MVAMTAETATFHQPKFSATDLTLWPTVEVIAAIDEARAGCSHPDLQASRAWMLRLAELQRELAIRNVRQTAALGEGGLTEAHVDALEKFVDRAHEEYPETCEAIARALELLGNQPHEAMSDVAVRIPRDLATDVSMAIERQAHVYRSDKGHDPEDIEMLQRDADRLEEIAEAITTQLETPC